MIRGLGRFGVMVFKATFNNVSAISWWSVLLVEETRISGENNRPTASHWQTLWHNVVYQVHITWVGFELRTLVVIGTDCIGSCKYNYYAIMTTMTPKYYRKNKLLFYDIMMMCALYYTTVLNCISFYSASSLKQQSTERHVAPFRKHFIYWLSSWDSSH
jgi:hypothetical protein